MSLKDLAKQDSKNDYAAPKGDWFKFKEGENKIRVLTEPIVIFEDYKMGICYTDCGFKGQMKYLAYIYNYATKAIEIMKIPMRIFDSIANLEENEDWAFQGFPMPYGITITAEGAGSKEVKYSLMPSPKRVDMPQEVIDELKKKNPIAEIIQRLKDKNKQAHDGGSAVTNELTKREEEYRSDQYPKDDINPDDIPF